jgi:hypothetical protein
MVPHNQKRPFSHLVHTFTHRQGFLLIETRMARTAIIPNFSKIKTFAQPWIANEKLFPVITLYQHESLPVSFYISLSHAANKTHIMNHR